MGGAGLVGVCGSPESPPPVDCGELLVNLVWGNVTTPHLSVRQHRTRTLSLGGYRLRSRCPWARGGAARVINNPSQVGLWVPVPSVAVMAARTGTGLERTSNRSQAGRVHGKDVAGTGGDTINRVWQPRASSMRTATGIAMTSPSMSQPTASFVEVTLMSLQTRARPHTRGTMVDTNKARSPPFHGASGAGRGGRRHASLGRARLPQTSGSQVDALASAGELTASCPSPTVPTPPTPCCQCSRRPSGPHQTRPV